MVVNQISGYKSKPVAAVRLADGSVTTNTEERQARWLEVFAKLYKAEVLTALEEVDVGELEPEVTNHRFSPTEQDVYDIIQKLPDGKAVGPDECPGEL